MLNKFFQQLLSRRQYEVPLAGLLLILGFATSGASLATSTNQSETTSADSTQVALAQAVTSTMPEGIYLYGRSPDPEEIGQEYLVFEAQHGKIVGAFYMPSSEFNCFHGTVESNQMNLTVLDPYDQTAFSYSIALNQETPVASNGDQLQTENQYQLEGYEAISTVSENDQRILSVCKANQPAQ